MEYTIKTVWSDGMVKNEAVQSLRQGMGAFEVYIEDPDCMSCVLYQWKEMEISQLILYYENPERGAWR